MIKIFLTIISVYLIYYAGNIAYDLFFKKDYPINQEDDEEFSLEEFITNKSSIKEVTIDDVEHLNTPRSYSTKELFSVMLEEQNEPYDLEHWRKKFESEKDIDAFELPPTIDEQTGKFEEVPYNNSVVQEDIKNVEEGVFSNPTSETDVHTDSQWKNESLPLKIQNQFNQFLSLAETNVQVLAEHDGYKVYHSII